MTSPIWRSWPSTFSPSGSVTSKSPSPLPGSSLAAISVGFSTGSPSANRFCPRPLPRDWCDASTKLRMGPLSEHRERLQELERDKKTLLESYADMLPDALDGLTAEERNRIYRMLRLKVRASEDKSI